VTEETDGRVKESSGWQNVKRNEQEVGQRRIWQGVKRGANEQINQTDGLIRLKTKKEENKDIL